MIRRPPRSTQSRSSAASDVYKRQFLLIGVDWMVGRDHSLTDTMMLVSIDTLTEKVAMVSVPRDTANFNLYYGGKVPSSFKLNTLMNAAMVKGFGSPDDPPKTLANEVGFLVGVPVNYYALIGLDGLAGMIDTMGGIDIYNPRAINDNTNTVSYTHLRAHETRHD